MWRVMVAVAIMSLPGSAQTQIDGHTQTKNVDYSTAAFTRPLKTGTSLPVTCTVGDMFFLSNAAAGANVFGCSSANSWSLEGGSTNLPAVTGNGGTVLSTDGTGLQWAHLGGDASGAPAATTVTGIRNRSLSATAPQSGQALIWNGSSQSWEPQTIASGQGALTLENNGTVVGTRAVANYIPGAGILNAISDTGTQFNIQHTIDSAVIQTRAGNQSGGALYCASASASPTNYTCALSPTLGAYTKGMVLYWLPDVGGSTGSITLNVDTLGGKAVKLADGVTDPTAADIVAGSLYTIWYDSVVFRLVVPPVNVGTAAAQPTCAVSLRGRIWQTFGASGVQDHVTVCAKDATNAYAWRSIY